MDDENSPPNFEIIPEDKNKQLSLPPELANRGLQLAARIELQRNIQKYQKPIRSFPGGQGPCCIEFSQNGRFAALTQYGTSHIPGCENPELIIRDFATGNTRILSAKTQGIKLGKVNSIALSGSGDLALAGYDDGRILCWDVKNKLLLHQNINPTEDKKPICCMKYSPDDIYFAASNFRYTKIKDTKTGADIKLFESRLRFYDQLAISNDGTKILVGHERLSGTIKLVDLGGSKEPLLFKRPKVDEYYAVSIFPDSRRAVSLDDAGIICVWDAITGAEITHWYHAKSPSAVNDIVASYSSNSHVTFPFNHENDIIIRVNETPPLIVKNPYIWGFSSVAVSPDGNRILSGGGDTTMRLWTTEGNEICEFSHNTQVIKVAFLPGGRHALSGCWDGSIYLWELP